VTIFAPCTRQNTIFNACDAERKICFQNENVDLENEMNHPSAMLDLYILKELACA
jgi:hypothetical protein